MRHMVHVDFVVDRARNGLYRIIVNIAYVFRAFNFRTSHAVRKYFNIEIFAIYGI